MDVNTSNTPIVLVAKAASTPLPTKATAGIIAHKKSEVNMSDQLEKIEFTFIGGSVVWVFDIAYAPNYRVQVHTKTKDRHQEFGSAKQPTINNARKIFNERIGNFKV